MNEDKLTEAIKKALTELGVPEMGYSGRVATAIEILQNALVANESPTLKPRKVKNNGTEVNS